MVFTLNGLRSTKINRVFVKENQYETFQFFYILLSIIILYQSRSITLTRNGIIGNRKYASVMGVTLGFIRKSDAFKRRNQKMKRRKRKGHP